MAERQITGRHVLIGFVGAFSVIIGVNLVLAWSAVRTFPGLEVKNSYVASQEFNERKAAQEGLGWTVEADHAGGSPGSEIGQAGRHVGVGAAAEGLVIRAADDVANRALAQRVRRRCDIDQAVSAVCV